MSVQSSLPASTTAPALGLPPMPAVTSGGDIYNARMDSLKALMQAGNGSLKGGSGGKYKKYKTKITGRVKLRRNNITKVMKGCSSKKTSKRGGAGGISPASQVEVPIPGGSSPTQVNTLASLSGGLLKLQQQAGNIAPPPPVTVKTMFSGGGGKRRHRKTNRKTNKGYRRLRYKKSIGRKGRSRRHRYSR